MAERRTTAREFRPLSTVVDARRGEWPLLLLAFGFHLALFFAYYILRPLRSEIQSQYSDMQDALYTATFVSVLVVVPIYAALVANRPRRVFLPIAYVFFAANLVGFWWVFRRYGGEFTFLWWTVRRGGALVRWTEWVYFVWVSAFNLFAVSIFWGFMADVFRPEQAKRLFGAIAAGASVGGIAGASFTASNVEAMGRANLVLLAGGVLAGSALFVWPLDLLARRRAPERDAPTSPQPEPTNSKRESIVGGLLAVARSPYLVAISLFIVLFTVSNTFLDMTRADFVRAAISDRDERTEFFAWQETAVNASTLVVQLFIVGRIMRWLGVAAALACLPVLSMLGFLVLGLVLLPLADGIASSEAADAAATLVDDPAVRRALIALVVFEVVQRMGRYALAKPSREVLFTVVERSSKYQAKPFIDTVVYRGGDVASAWSYSLLHKSLGLSLAAICFVAAPIAVAGIMLAFWLGRRQARLAGDPISSGSASDSQRAATR